MRLILYPAVGETVADEDGNVIPPQGIGPIKITPYSGLRVAGSTITILPNQGVDFRWRADTSRWIQCGPVVVT